MSMYVHTNKTSTSMTIPRVIHVVLRPFFDTAERVFFDDRVFVKLSRESSARLWGTDGTRPTLECILRYLQYGLLLLERIGEVHSVEL